MFYHQIGGHQASSEIHCNNEKDTDPFPARKILHTEGICRQVKHDHGKHRPYHGILNAVPITRQNTGIRKYSRIPIHRKPAWHQKCFSRIYIVRIGHGSHQYIVQRICHNKQNSRTDNHQHNIACPFGKPCGPSGFYICSHIIHKNPPFYLHLHSSCPHCPCPIGLERVKNCFPAAHSLIQNWYLRIFYLPSYSLPSEGQCSPPC